MIYLNKFLPMVFSPLGLISALLIFALFARKKKYIVIALVLFWVCSLPVVSNALLGHLSKGILSGKLKKLKTSSSNCFEWNGSKYQQKLRHRF